MSLAYAAVVGGLVGAAVSVGALQLRMPSILQSVAAVLGAVLLSTGVISFLGDTGDGYWGVGVEELVRLSLLTGLSAVLHVLLGAAFGGSHPSLLEYRPLALGSAYGIYTSVAVAIALNSLSKLNVG